jgi:hypothetical protein
MDAQPMGRIGPETYNREIGHFRLSVGQVLQEFGVHAATAGIRERILARRKRRRATVKIPMRRQR